MSDATRGFVPSDKVGSIIRISGEWMTSGGLEIEWSCAVHAKWWTDFVSGARRYEDEKWVMTIWDGGTQFRISIDKRENVVKLIAWLEAQGVDMREKIRNYDTWKEEK